VLKNKRKKVGRRILNACGHSACHHLKPKPDPHPASPLKRGRGEKPPRIMRQAKHRANIDQAQPNIEQALTKRQGLKGCGQPFFAVYRDLAAIVFDFLG